MSPTLSTALYMALLHDTAARLPTVSAAGSHPFLPFFYVQSQRQYFLWICTVVPIFFVPLGALSIIRAHSSGGVVVMVHLLYLFGPVRDFCLLL